VTEAGHQWGAMLAMLAGEPLPPVPPATGAAWRHHVDGFGPAVDAQMVRVFGDEDRANFWPLSPKPDTSTRAHLDTLDV